MSPAQETLDNIRRENRRGQDEQVTFLLEEIEYRENQITQLIDQLELQMVNLPQWVRDMANEYGIEVTE